MEQGSVLTPEIVLPYWSPPEKREPSPESATLSVGVSDSVIRYVSPDVSASRHVPPSVPWDETAENVPSGFTVTVLGATSNQFHVPTKPPLPAVRVAERVKPYWFPPLSDRPVRQLPARGERSRSHRVVRANHNGRTV